MICVSEHRTVMTGVLGIAHALTSSHLAEEKTEGQRGSPTSEYKMVVSPYLLFSSWKASKGNKRNDGNANLFLGMLKDSCNFVF